MNLEVVQIQFLVGFNGCNSVALITLEKQDTFLTSREKYKTPIFDALQQSKNSLLFCSGKESSINDVRKKLSA